MSEDSAVLDATEGKKESVEEFDYTQYSQYFPSAIAEKLTESFSTKARGWKRNARLLIDIARYDRMTQEREQALLKGFQRSAVLLTERDHGRKYLEGLSEEKLHRACDRYNVSIPAFANDLAGMIEAILDEMERED